MRYVEQEASPLIAPSGRARGIAAGLSGLFALLWFNWGSTAVSSPVSHLLDVARALALLLIVGGIVLTARSAAGSTPMTSPAIRRKYGALVGAEFALLAAGNVVFAAAGLGEWIPVWVCLGVGLHFLPLARVFRETSLNVLGGALVVAAAGALISGLTTAAAPRMVAGTGAGLCLLAWGMVALGRKRLFTGLSPSATPLQLALTKGRS